MTAQPTGTVTLLFTDIEGSTRLLERIGPERYGDLLDLHHRLLRASFVRHGGYEVDSEGDAFFVTFVRTSAAIAAAADAQQALAAAPWPEDGTLRVRMGIHTGEPLPAPPKYVGVDVHKAARIMASAHGGQVLVSQATRELVNDTLEGLSLRDLGEYRLKDLAEPQRLYQLVIPALDSDFPPPRTLESRPTNLPSQATPLLGRDNELRELGALVAQEDVRLVTLTGPGGTGKTRLALRLGAELIEEFSDGVFFVDLSALTDAALVLPTVAQTLGAKQQPDETVESGLGEHLRPKRMLVVLDNFEQVLEAAPHVAAVIRETDGVKLLVTSRSRLHLTGEREYPVPPLNETESIDLFVERAKAVKPTFFLNGNRSVIAEICARLDHLPLAIELAAARVKLLPEQALLERLDRRLTLLTGGARDVDERQRTLRATIEWSYGLLSPPESRLLRRLAVFAGGRPLDAVEAVCDQAGDLGVDVLEGLASLIDKSLLRGEESDGEQPRYTMLETIHEFARERLEEDDDHDELRRRHAHWFVAFAEEVDARLQAFDQQSHWMNRFRTERDNLRIARDFLADTNDAERLLRLAVASWEPWMIIGYQAQARKQLVASLPDEPPPTWIGIRALEGAAYLAYVQNEIAEARKWVRQLRALADQSGDAEGRARSLHMAAIVSDDDNDRYELEQRALELAGNAPWAAQMRESVGLLAWRQKDLEQAQRVFEEVVETATRHGDDLAIPTAQVILALVLAERGDCPRATEQLAAGVDAAKRIGDQTPVIWHRCWIVLARILADRNAPAAALSVLGAAEAVLERSGHQLRGFTAEMSQRTVTYISGLLSEEQALESLTAGRADASVEYLQRKFDEVVGGVAAMEPRG